MKYVIIIGTGGFAREVLWLIREINREASQQAFRQPPFKVLGFVEEGSAGAGAELGGFPVLGDDAWVFEELDRSVTFVVAIGSPKLRGEIAARYLEAGFRPATLIHPNVRMGEDVTLGQGCVISAGAVLTTNIQLGDFNTVNLNATIGHDSQLGACVSVHPGANISGGVQIGKEVEIGSGAVVLQGIAIGDQSVVGAGAVVTEDLEGGGVYVGVPAKALEKGS